MQPVIALLTDFGTADSYVGVMKGVMLGIHAQTRFIDITHAIQPQNVRQAAFVLMNAYRYFPPGTVFLVVVDPGVGSARRPLVISAGGYLFVGPDNGVFSDVLHDWPDATLVEPTESRFLLPRISSTFHGRDIFAPVAAHLAADTPLQAVGLVVTDPVLLDAPLLDIGNERLAGEVLHVDHFGNLITSIGVMQWAGAAALALTPRFGAARDAILVDADRAVVRAGDVTLHGIRQTYAQAQPGELLAAVGSDGFLEIAMNHGSAARHTGLTIGDTVELRLTGG